MKLLIDIPKANYEKMKIMDGKGTLENPYLMAIAQGTPLLKEQGQWIKLQSDIQYTDTDQLEQHFLYKCSECGCCSKQGNDNYCPNCKRKMERKEGD